MARKGGQTTFSGTKFQAEITVLYMGRMLDQRPRNEEDKVSEVRPEADVEAEVDDILVRFQDGHAEYIQAKEKITKSKSDTSAWVKMWKHFASQLWSDDFAQGDKIVLALGQPQTWTDDLRSACESASDSARDSQEWYDKWLTTSQINLVDDVRNILFPLDPEIPLPPEQKSQQNLQLFELFGNTFVRLYDPERIRRDHGPHFMPESNRDWGSMYDLLLRIVWESAEKGRAIDSNWLLEKIRAEGVTIYSPGDRVKVTVSGMQISYIRVEPVELLEKIDDLQDLNGVPPGSRMLFQRNAVFTGREDELKDLAKSLMYDENAVVVTAMGGMGKSQLAVEFCYRYGRYFHGVHWLQANQDMLAEIATCGLEMGLKPWPETVPEQAQAVLNAWEQGGARLVVLDDAEDPALIQEWSPKLNNSRLLVTSRWGDWPADMGLSLIKLKTLPRGKSLELLRKLAPKLDRASDGDLDAIAERLGDLPLALDLAGRYLNDRRTLSTKGFLEELDQAGSVLEHSALKDWVKHNPTKHEINLAKTFLQSWEKLESETAKVLFRICGYCAPNTPIPWDVLEGSSEVEGAELDRGLGRLEDLGLVSLGDIGAVIPPLLAEFARMQDENVEQSVLPALVSELGKLSDEALETGIPANFIPLRAHMEAAANAAESAELEGAGWLWNNLGHHLADVAEYEGAKAAYERALAIDEAAFGPDHPNVAIRVNNLGWVLQNLGDYAEARVAYKRALAINEATLGTDHPDVATTVSNLGLVLKDLGDYAGAKAAFERALAIDEGAFGPDHPDVARDTNNLGLVQYAQGDLERAKVAFERALAIWEKELGPDHPQVATGTNNLGEVLRALGDYAGAKAAYERALAIDEAAFGPNHPNVARDVNNLGGVLQNQGDHAGAKAAYERALKIWEVELGPDHPQVAALMNNLGDMLRAQGEFAEAKAAIERALAIGEKTLRPDHPSIAIRLNNLGLVLYALGDYTEAKAAIEHALSIWEKELGPNHPQVATGTNNLGEVLRAQGDLEGAKAAYERALAIDETAFGPNHPSIAIRVNNLGLVLQAQGDYAGAKAAYERALAILKKYLPEDHTNILTVRENLEILAEEFKGKQ